MIDVISESSPSQLTYILKMKDMHFLWKNYMDNLKIPNIVYQSTVKQLLINKYEFNSDTECFVKIKVNIYLWCANLLSFGKQI